MKTWILEAVNKVNAMFARSDLPPREDLLRAAARPARAARVELTDAPASEEHLGPYAPLIVAIRDELERFVAAQVRLHLAFAEHDRFLLTSIEVRCVDSGEPRDLLHRFTREFKPEQIKRYLIRQVVPALPNAAAIDLSQFGGLAVPAEAPAGENDEFAELLEALRTSAPADGAYEVTVKGRWIEGEPIAEAGTAAPATPPAERRLDVDIEDAQGGRCVGLPSVAPGRRYVIGKDAGCGIVVAGTYTSRRHCEIWLERGAWWVADAGSTNGIRVELGTRVLGLSSSQGGAKPEAIRLVPGARIVLSGLADGARNDYPSVMLRLDSAASPVTPLAPVPRAPGTPITPVAVALRCPAAWTLTAHMAGGDRTVQVDSARLPFTIGRSRNQVLVVDEAHEGASGHHLDITGVEDAGLAVLVHGDNGVLVDQATHPAGDRFVWHAGESIVLGRAWPDEPVCMLTLARRT